MLFWIFVILFIIWTIKLNIHKIPGKGGIQPQKKKTGFLNNIFCLRTFQPAPVWVSGKHDDCLPDSPLSSLPRDARHVRGLRPGHEGHAGRPGVDHPLRAAGDQAVRHDSAVNISSGI